MSIETEDNPNTRMPVDAPITSQSANDRDNSEASAAQPVETNRSTDASRAGSRLRRAFSFGWIARSVPTVLVMIVLAGLGYYGHHHDWKLPKFSELTGHAEAKGVAWCEEHGVPEADCIACNADLMPKGKLHGWCKEHGVHECALHHPEVVQLTEAPSVSQADLDRAARAIAIRPRKKNDPTCKMHLRRIQLPSKAAVDKAGIDINLVDRSRVVETVAATGEIIYDPTLVARLASRAPGTVWRVEKNIGHRVRQGEVLALVDAAEVGQTKAELLQAAVRLNLQKKTYERLRDLGTVVAGKRVLEAQTAVAEAEAAVQKVIQALVNLGMPVTYADVLETPADALKLKIQFLGLPSHIVADLDPARTTSNLIPVFAPRDGIVVKRDVVAGEVVDINRTLFTVADTSRMWLVLNVPLEEAKYVAIGQQVNFRADGADRTDVGRLTWMSTGVDNETRTVKVRGELPNLDGHLRNETFGVGEIVLREEENAILVPNSALHWEGCCHVVFVRDKDFMKKGAYKVFHTRSVRPGVVMGDTTEMIAGLWPGEVVVTKGSGVLRAELLKGNLGAG